MRSNLFTSLIITALTMALPIVSFGADQEQAKQSAAIEATASTKMTPELKKDMADMYPKMADCLRSDKSLDTCRHEALTNCPVVKKTGYCPINEGLGKRMKHSTGSGKNGDVSNTK